MHYARLSTRINTWRVGFEAVSADDGGGSFDSIESALRSVSMFADLERISGVTRAISELSATSVSFWSDDVATVDWFESFDLSRLDENNRLLLEETNIAYTTRDLWSDEALHVHARVCVNMVTFWDTSLSVQCQDRYCNVSYEGQRMLLYRELVPLLKEVK